MVPPYGRELFKWKSRYFRYEECQLKEATSEERDIDLDNGKVIGLNLIYADEDFSWHKMVKCSYL